MDLKAEIFVDRLLGKEARQTSDSVLKVEDLEMKLPDWFDEKKFNQGRRFYSDFCFMFSVTMMLGLLAVFSIPSILRVLVDTRRSNSVYTAYKRYFSTRMHMSSWFENELKPGSKSWRSLYTVRSRHIQADRAARLKGKGSVSQRDIALTLFGFIGFAFLKPSQFSIRQLKADDWEAYNHCWKVIGHMIGLQDRYNICQDTYEETRQVCQILQDRVFTPCLENVPEYFEHMSRVMVDGLRYIIPVNTAAAMYAVRYVANVPGYIYTEQERIDFQNKLRKCQKNGKDFDMGIESTMLVQKCAIEGLPDRPKKMFYIHDFDTLENVPAYRELPFKAKYELASNNIFVSLYATDIGRIFINYYLKFSIFISTYFPYSAMWRFGIKNAYVNMFKEDPTDETILKTNSEYIKQQSPEPWYKIILSFFW